jgi:hypothetical protein
MSSSLLRREIIKSQNSSEQHRITQNISKQLRKTQKNQKKPTYISTTLRDSARCVIGVVNVEVGPLVGAIHFCLNPLNLRQTVQ